jgi:hypothetical protein
MRFGLGFVSDFFSSSRRILRLISKKMLGASEKTNSYALK